MEKCKLIISKIFPWILIFLTALIIYQQFNHYAVSVPLAGDDWGYAYSGMHDNPFKLAFDMYFNWSGRFFAELWGFLIAPNKELWNTLNPLLFVGVTVLILIIYGDTSKMWINIPVVLLCIFSVSTTLRLETYAWIMGSTYVTALLALLIHLLCLKQIVFNHKHAYLYASISTFACFFVGLDMENAAAICVLSNLLALGYCVFIKDKKTAKVLIMPMIVSIIAIILLRISPGANYRLTVDNVAFNQLNLFEKLSVNWPNFLYYTFIDSPYSLMCISLLFTIYSGIKFLHQRKSYQYLAICLFYLISLGVLLSPNIYNATDINILKIFFDVYYSRSALIFVSLFYCLYTLISLYTMATFTCKQTCLMGIFTLLLAGVANGVMLLSPIFGARSSIYTVYLLMGLALLIIQEITQPILLSIVMLGCSLFSYKKMSYLDLVYDQVAYRTKERAIQIEYYQTHLDEDIHITRYRKNTVHSADIETGDDYHFEQFKKYYGFDLDRKVIFESLPEEAQ